MPLFRRSDGVLIKDLSPERAIMPHVMRGRNESAVYHDVLYDITKARKWLRDFNRAGSHGAATLFHLIIWACVYGLHRRPEMNRFVAGRRLYQRNEVSVSFAAKQTMSREAPMVTVKVHFDDPEESLRSASERISSAIVEGRGSGQRDVDKELRLAAMLPVFLVSFIMWMLRLLDRMNLLPRRLLASDPMYASLFVANLGSVGLDNTYHHLYDYGTASVFAALGTPQKTLFIGRGGEPEVRDGIRIRYTLDERIADGFTAGDGLKMVKKVIEDPERYLGTPEEAAEAGRRAEEAA